MFRSICQRREKIVREVFGYRLLVLWLVFPGLPSIAHERAEIQPRRQLSADGSKDQDDFCFWRRPSDPLQSLIIASDKSANLLFVYGLDGRLLQRVAVTKPGNIDIRQGVMLDGKRTDVVVVNQRSDGFKLRIFRVDPESHGLVPLDDGQVATGPNYGGCLYHSRITDKLYFFCTSEIGTIEQHELAGNGAGGVRGKLVRTWNIGKCEGAVADDETGMLYISEESKGIWKVGAEPDQSSPGEVIAEVGQRHDLTGDLEGMAIYRPAKDKACLLVSDQGKSRFVAFDLKAPHRRIGDFTIIGAKNTDGIDLVAAPLGPEFPDGIFACHTDVGARSVQLSSLAEIRPRLKFEEPRTP